MSAIPPPPSSEPPPPAAGPPVAERVSGPAVGLMVTAGIGIAFQILGLLMSILNIGMAGMDPSMYGDEVPGWMTMMASGTISVVFAIIGILIGGLIFYAAMQMRKLQSYGLAMAASIIAMVPCISPCCILGLPIGIWALVVLTKPEVKAAFT